MNKKEQKKILSIVSPVYNEAENLGEFYSRVINATDNLNLEIEIIYINDGSQDSTIDIITKQRQIDNRITIIDLSRNFGKEIALTAGLDYSSGDAVIVIDADLQDDPAEIKNIIKKINEGYDMVTGWKIKRKDPYTKTLPSKVFNYILKCSCLGQIPTIIITYR